MAPRAAALAASTTYDSDDALQSSNGLDDKRSMAATTRAKTTTRRASAGKPATKRKAAPKQPRQALKDRTNLQPASDTEEVEEFDDDAMDTKPKAKRAKTTTARKPAASKETKKSTAPAKKKTVKRAPSLDALATIPETQQDPDRMEDVEQSIEMDPSNMDIAQEPTPKPVQKFVQRAPSLQPRASTRPGSSQPTYAPIRERSGSASVVERRGGDPELRRTLNEMTKKYETLKLKHESLEEIGKRSAETNFEKLKRASDQKAKDASELIKSLKKELADLKKSTSSVSTETTGLQKQIDSLTTSNNKLTVERDDLKGKHQVSQNEVKSLEAKLMTARQQISHSAQEAETAAKKHTTGTALSLGDAQKEAKMKENLYADLTGLLIRAVKRKDGEDEYDCIQTGRNGTLHFHLSIANDSTTPHPKTPSGLSYEEAEFAYEPLLDESRDRDLLDLLPDYLTEEICFPRNHAQRFYSKVVDSMTKRIIVEDD
ncbi:chromosome segregation protein [Zymoseptoria brevis]|uniref:Chromosome segregation protein n=1 Tax=Zymoseptoria brevis TaxID=1047168 RepID=A0A0F4GUU3_9PEZI|nr:chromosome segregation protein [Zymoseptoria brevis]